MELPRIVNEVRVAYIDAQLDGLYALRILRHYREKCNERWEVRGLSEGDEAIYRVMNEHQFQRAKELDRAITILEQALEGGKE